MYIYIYSQFVNYMYLNTRLNAVNNRFYLFGLRYPLCQVYIIFAFIQPQYIDINDQNTKLLNLATHTVIVVRVLKAILN